jgi:hypothetical protein
LEELQLHHHPKTITKAKKSGYSLSLSQPVPFSTPKDHKVRKPTRKEAPISHP